MGDLNKYKSAISTSICISLFYEFMISPDICYCYMLIVSAYQCMCIRISYMFPTKHKG